ncbi:HNH endonuclease [Paraburkholderia caballeronis]|nr:HNH endonuclease [Paraburkholderia caballeronis]TDV07914.1 HNH endonuclease [Paraburkholderia caballeronis]TDV18205.1 HNH endonuclease [Paraburkholderia caballeronis]
MPVLRMGYPTVELKCNGRKELLTISRCMLTVFVGPPPSEEHQACHNNGVPTENNLGNLRWDTRIGNAADTLAHGTRLIGEGHPNSKLTDELVREIRASSETGAQLAKRMGVSTGVIYKARAGDTWKHVRAKAS